MITQLRNLPNTMVGFRASGEVTRENFDQVVLPAIAELVQRTDELNYMFVVDTPLKNLMLGAWIKEALVGLNNLNKGNRCSIVSDSENITAFSKLFDNTMPGDFKGYSPAEIDAAIAWTSGHREAVFQEEGNSEE